MNTALITPQTIAEICAARDSALKLYDDAWQAMATAQSKLDQAHAMAKEAAPTTGGWGQHLDETKKTFFKSLKLPPFEQFQYCAKRIVDTDCWGHIIEKTGLEMLMDTTAKKELENQMREERPRSKRRGYDSAGTFQEVLTDDDAKKGMPEITVENVRATVQTMMANSGDMFMRGLVNSFTALDRRFRSHDGFKIGSRMIIDRLCCSVFGGISHGDRRNRLIDIERVFLALDGKAANYAYASIVTQVDRERGYNAGQTEHEGAYFKVRIFKNGNAHLWFTRKDLLTRINKMLAEHYGEVIGDGMTKEADATENRKTTVAKNFGFYPTPDALADSVTEYLVRPWGNKSAMVRVLEPSAGTGQLSKRLVKDFTRVDCVEIQAPLAAGLESAGIYNRVYNLDFLALSPATTGLYDLIVMNPPFDLERDIDHVSHAIKFLAPGGKLVSIMSAGTEYRQTKKSEAFRAIAESMGAKWRDNPLGSFASVGTYVNTVTLTLTKEGGE